MRIVYQAARAFNSSRRVVRQTFSPADLEARLILLYNLDRLDHCYCHSCHLPAPGLFQVSVQCHESEVTAASIGGAPNTLSGSTEYDSPVG